MRKTTSLLIVLILLLLPLMAQADIRGLPSVTILADSSMTSALTELSRYYSREHNISVTADFGAAEELASEIVEGLSADVFVSAHPDVITDLKRQGLIDVYSFSNLVEDRLVFAAPKDHILSRVYADTVDFQALLSAVYEKEVPIAIMVVGDSSTSSLGFFTTKAIAQLGFLKRLKPIFLPAMTSREALYLIAKGGNSGIIFTSDATANNEEVTVISEIPDDLHPLILYQAGAIAGENMEAARDFVEYLKSPTAMKVFEKHGFFTKR